LRFRLADHLNGAIQDPTALVGLLDLIAQMACEQHNVGEAVTGQLEEQDIEETLPGRDLKKGLWHPFGQLAQARSLAANQDNCLSDMHEFDAIDWISPLCCGAGGGVKPDPPLFGPAPGLPRQDAAMAPNLAAPEPHCARFTARLAARFSKAKGLFCMLIQSVGAITAGWRGTKGALSCISNWL
jgi:hypothetical protein